MRQIGPGGSAPLMDRNRESPDPLGTVTCLAGPARCGYRDRGMRGHVAGIAARAYAGPQGSNGMITIRPERPVDHSAIYEVNRLAFGRENEARLVDALRLSDGFLPELSLVACSADVIIGHILFTRITIDSPNRSAPALALAPMAVLPAHRRQGIGSMLVREGLEQCRRLGHGIVVVLGHAEYYPRFGFVPARPRRILAPFPAPDEVFMVLELTTGALQGVAGTVHYPPEFDAV